MSRIRYTHKNYLSYANIFSGILHHSFNASVNEGTFPSVFQLTDVTPISEKDFKDNYRPISILKNLSKVFEKHYV